MNLIGAPIEILFFGENVFAFQIAYLYSAQRLIVNKR